MVKYPVQVERSPYRGSDPKKLLEQFDYNSDAKTLEDHINSKIQGGRTGLFTYSELAFELGLDRARVRQILYPQCGGDSGFTVAPRDGEMDETKKKL